MFTSPSSAPGPVCVGVSQDIFSLTRGHPSYTSAGQVEDPCSHLREQAHSHDRASTPLINLEETNDEPQEVSPDGRRKYYNEFMQEKRRGNKGLSRQKGNSSSNNAQQARGMSRDNNDAFLACTHCSTDDERSRAPATSSGGRCNITEYKHILARLDLQDETDRRTTFRYWPTTNAAIAKEQMARNGLYFSGVGDMVECYACTAMLGNWSSGQNSMLRHRNANPTCRHLALLDTDNRVSIRSDLLHEPRPEPAEEFYFEPYSATMQDYQRRLNTFVAFRPNRSLQFTVERFCDAGFFATGTGDRVICWCCGKSLSNFLASDDPWVEHARWSPGCQFLRVKRGSEFVHQVQQQHQPSVPSQMPQRNFPNVESGPTRIPTPTNTEPPNERTREEMLASALQQDNTRRAIEIFGIERVATVMRRKIQRDNCYYHSVEALCDAVIGSYAPSRTEPDDVVELSESRLPSSSQATSTGRIEELEQIHRCKVCLNNQATVVLLECRHLCVCAECSRMLVTCPLCRRCITARMDVYL